MIDEAVQQLLDGFVVAVGKVAAVEAVWLHGSLALGDYQLGRSDLDVIVVTSSPPPPAVADVHRQLIRDFPLAAKLHCSYMTDLSDVSVRHPTFAHQEYFDRLVSPVTRRELAIGNFTLIGPPPSELLPAITDDELLDFVRRDLHDFWLPATQKWRNWYTDIWVDLGLLTVARAHVTLASGDLITKRAAFDVLPYLGAPADVVEDVRRRRYGPVFRTGPAWRHTRAGLTRRFLSTAIPAVLGSSVSSR
ncbi:nucleotidyltransferase domain-containing protein [Kribbella sp. NPDC055071]